MPIAMTNQQRDELDEQGFTLLERVLTQPELERVSTAMDEVADQLRQERGLGPNDSVSRRNGLVCHEAILDLLDHPKILPLVVDAVGWNIQNRDCTFDYKMPMPDDADPDILSLGWHCDYEEEFAGTTIDGRMPPVGLQSRLVHFRSHRARSQHDSARAGELQVDPRATRHLGVVARSGRNL